jgi:hypothetical protein
VDCGDVIRFFQIPTDPPSGVLPRNRWIGVAYSLCAFASLSINRRYTHRQVNERNRLVTTAI